ncbi:MAG: hypothetical protein QM640_03060 [Niabella sp.]
MDYYCNIPLPQRKLDGSSLKQVIASATAPGPHPEFFWQSSGAKDNPQWAVMEGAWKLLHSPFESEKSELTADGLMLVNMKADSTEHTNEANKHPDIVQRLRLKYQAWIKDVVNQ